LISQKGEKMKKFSSLLVLLLLTGSSPAFGDWHQVLSNIEDRVNQDESIGNHDLEMHYRQGSVILKGRVGNERDLYTIEDIARSVDGVEEVTNWMEVDSELSSKPEPAVRAMPKPPLKDSEIEQEIRAALKKTDKIGTGIPDVQVLEGRVTFRGDRNNFREIDKILAITLMLEGVTGVESEMTVNGKPYPEFKL
jgi:osmotically-inducible protein OsmY